MCVAVTNLALKSNKWLKKKKIQETFPHVVSMDEVCEQSLMDNEVNGFSPSLASLSLSLLDSLISLLVLTFSLRFLKKKGRTNLLL